MKFIYIVLFFIFCDGLESIRFIHKYPYPLRAKLFKKENKAKLEITWEPVEDWDKEDPIIGYKVLVWEIEKPKVLVQKIVDGELIEEEEEGPPSTSIVGNGPTTFTVPINNRNVTLEDIKVGISYEYSALAFTKKGEGPRSPTVGVQRGG